MGSELVQPYGRADVSVSLPLLGPTSEMLPFLGFPLGRKGDDDYFRTTCAPRASR